MKFNNTTYMISVSLLVIWAIYVFFIRGFVGILLTGGIALVVASMVDSLELVTGATIIGGYLLLWAMSRIRMFEPFMDTPKQITERLAAASKADKFTVEGPSDPRARAAVRMEMGEGPRKIVGVYDCDGIEGFEDAGAPGAPDNSTPAPTASTKEISSQFQDTIMSTVSALTEKAKKDSNEKTTTSTDAQAGASPTKTESPFRSDPSGLFKLGEIPTESRDGPIIDAGATFMKALNALDPSQIKSMSDDTAKMVDAQKNLIGLLNTMKPILQDGQKLMQTFTSVLGQPGGVSGAALSLGK